MRANRILLLIISFLSTMYLCQGQFIETIHCLEQNNSQSVLYKEINCYQDFTPLAIQSQNLSARTEFNLKLDSIVTKVYPLSPLPELYSKQKFLYDDQGIHKTTITYTWFSFLGAWEPTFKDEYIFDPEGRLIERSRQKWEEDLQVFEDFQKMEYRYTADRLDQIEIYSFHFPKNWEKLYRHIFHYNELGKLNTVLVYEYQQNDLWFGKVKKDYVYGEDGNMKREIIMEVDPVLLQWENTWENSFIFEEGNLIEQEIYSWYKNLGFWLEAEKIYFQYDSLSGTEDIALPVSLLSSMNRLEQREYFHWDLEEDDYTITYVSDYFYGDFNVGIDKISSKEIIIYPNPVLQKFFIQSPLNEARIEILQTNGTVIKELTYTQGQAIDISYLPPGMYFVRIFDDRSQGIKKIIKK